MSQTTALNALHRDSAYQLSDITKTLPQFGALTPRWLTKLLEFKVIKSGIYRVNRVVGGQTPLDVLCSQDRTTSEIPQGYIEYQAKPREYEISSITTIIN
jgi:hypothetical protein